jgi:alkylation response protein AidB-like acyl-CoA dehydrogenase
MEFQFTDEQEQFREFVRRFFNDTTPTTEVRRIMESQSGFDEGIWHRLASELSLTGISIPEAYGGSGFGIVELGIAMEEMGRCLYPSPYLASCVLAAKALEFVASETQRSELLPAIAAGEQVTTLAFLENEGAPVVTDVSCTATQSGDEFELTGNKHFVLDAMVADYLLVTAMTEKGLSLFQVDRTAPGLNVRALKVIDPTRRVSKVELVNTPGVLVGAEGAAQEGLERALNIAFIALANESVGGAERLFQDTLEYTKLRHQFGRTIASFQAIKHRMTEYLLSVELAKSAAYYTAEAADVGEEDLAKLASIAKASASEAYLKAGVESIQLHGGIGFTWENDTHLWFKRAKSSEVFLGNPSWHRARLIERMVKEQAA